MDRKVIGRVTASVAFPLYEGDRWEEHMDWSGFAYIGPQCARACHTLQAITQVVEEEDQALEALV